MIVRRIAPVLTLAFVPAALLARDPVAPEKKAVLVAKSAGAFVHFLPPQTKDDWLEAKLGGTLVLTSRESGAMTVLLTSGTWSDHKRRATYFQNRILGVAADNERLYVLMFAMTRPDSWPPPANKSFDLPAKNNPAGRWDESWSFNLTVFRLKDGTQLMARELNGNGLPKTVPAEATESGALKLIKGGIEVYGVSVTLDGQAK